MRMVPPTDEQVLTFLADFFSKEIGHQIVITEVDMSRPLSTWLGVKDDKFSRFYNLADSIEEFYGMTEENFSPPEENTTLADLVSEIQNVAFVPEEPNSEKDHCVVYVEKYFAQQDDDTWEGDDEYTEIPSAGYQYETAIIENVSIQGVKIVSEAWKELLKARDMMNWHLVTHSIMPYGDVSGVSPTYSIVATFRKLAD